MFDLLIAYWWIFVLVLIAILIITRNLVKFLIGAVVFIVLINLIWMIFISPAFKGSIQCFVEDSARVESGNIIAQEMKPGVDRNMYICGNLEEDFYTLVSCLRNVKARNSFGFFVNSSLPKFKKGLRDRVSEQMEYCPNNPISYPSF